MSVLAAAAAATATCLFGGDSTAIGAASAYNAHAAAPCVVVARERLSPAAVARLPFPAFRFDTAILGSGSNDPTSPILINALYATRTRISAGRVLWLLPYNRHAAAIVRQVAAVFGDFVLDLSELPTRDGLHPATYSGIGIALRRWPLQ